MTSTELAQLCQGIPIQVVEGFSGPKPKPLRSASIDPDTVLKRRDWLIRPMHQGTYLDRRAKGECK